jgi:hypothetical protein
MDATKELKTAEDFRDFFAGIPEDKWCVGFYTDRQDRHCALGHLGQYQPSAYHFRDLLGKSFGAHSSINDGSPFCPPQFRRLQTPKARILAALDSIIAQQKGAE